MAESELKILITAIDNASKMLERIEGQIGKSQVAISKSTEKASVSMNDQIGSLIALGNAANAVDGIFSSYQNLQLRLENAQERVNNAQDRFTDAQDKVNKLIKEGKRNTQEYIDAQKELDRASRGLTVSQNNQARAQNQVVGTYIQMGIQTMSLLKSLPALKLSIEGMTKASLAFIATPLGAVLLGIGLIILGVTSKMKEQKDWAEKINATQEKRVELESRLADKAGTTRAEIQKTYDLISGAINTKSQDELNLNAKIAENEYELALLKQDGSDKAIIAKESEIAVYRGQLDVIAKQRAAETAAHEATVLESQTTYDALTEQQKQFIDFQKLSYEDALKYINEQYNPKVLAAVAEREEAYNREIAKLRELQTMQETVKNISTTKKVGIFASIVKNIGFKPSGETKNDFISRPGQNAVNFSPNDTIIGMEDIGNLRGTTINITGNNYGTDPQEISEAIMSKLKNKISL